MQFYLTRDHKAALVPLAYGLIIDHLKHQRVEIDAEIQRLEAERASKKANAHFESALDAEYGPAYGRR